MLTIRATTSQEMESAIAILKKAVELDRSENYSESLELYHEGIQKLLNIVPGKIQSLTNYLVNKYVNFF